MNADTTSLGDETDDLVPGHRLAAARHQREQVPDALHLNIGGAGNARGRPGHDGQGLEDLEVESGGLVLFADGLRFDVSQRLVERMRTKGWSVTLSTRWAGLPTVTATAKPAVSPVSKGIKGLSLGEDFLPATADAE